MPLQGGYPGRPGPHPAPSGLEIGLAGGPALEHTDITVMTDDEALYYICSRNLDKSSPPACKRGIHYDRVLEQPHNGATSNCKGPSVLAKRPK